MKTYRWDDLKDIGINPLTGEADAYGQRLLCDLNEDGRELVEKFFGLPLGTALNPNWNSMVGEKPAVASVMLTRDTLWSLVKFHVFVVDDADAYVQNNYTITALNATGEYYAAYEKLCAEDSTVRAKFVRNPAKHSTQPRVGDRNVHAATGRTA